MTRPFKPSDIDFLMRTLVYSLLFLAILHAFKPYFSDSHAEPSFSEIESFSQQVRLITPDDVSGYLTESTRPTMVVIYASWCSYCRKIMPSIHELWKESRINGDQMLLISLDKTVTDLSKYLLTNKMQGMLNTPVVLKKDNATLAAALKKHGSGFDGGIPYIGFFGPGGKLRDEIPGAVSKGEIQASLSNLN